MSFALRHTRHTVHLWYELGWPVELDPKQVTAWLQALGAANRNGLRFLIRADARELKHYIIIPARHARAVIQLLRTFLPEIEAVEVNPFELKAMAAAKVRMTSKHRALNTKQPETVSYAILSTLRILYRDESMLFEWILGDRVSPQAVPNNVTGFQSDSWLRAIAEATLHEPKQLDAQSRTNMQEKHAASSWKAALYIGSTSDGGTKRAQYLLGQVVDALRSSEAPGVRIGMRLSWPVCMQPNYTPFFWPLRVNAHELAGLLAWPLGNRQLPGLERMTNKRLAVTAQAPHGKRIVAASNLTGSKRLLTLSPKDALMHMHLLGPTGTGKTTLMANLIVQDIKDGRSIIAVDPKLDLISKVLERIPRKRYNDVIVLDPSDTDRPVGLNPLAQHGQPATLIADDILHIFHSLYGSFFGPRTQDILHAGLLTLSDSPGMSLCTLPLLYTNATFRTRLVEQLHDPLGLGSFWSWFDTISDRERNAAVAPLMNKLRAFLLRPAMRRVIGQGQPKLDLNDVMRGNKILLISLAEGMLGMETSRLFGALVLSQIWQAIQGRVNLPPQQRKPMFLYVDEMQDYLHLPTDIGHVLNQARSYGVGVVLAHQFLSQLPPDMKSGVLSNARSRVCFQLSHEDAITMSRNSTTLAPADFENLNRQNIYARLVGNGEVLPWASGKTLAPTRVTSKPDALRQLSRERYGQNAAETETAIAAQITGIGLGDQPPAIGHIAKTGGDI